MRTPEFVVGQAKLYVAWVRHLQVASEVGQSFEPEPFNLWDLMLTPGRHCQMNGIVGHHAGVRELEN